MNQSTCFAQKVASTVADRFDEIARIFRQAAESDFPSQIEQAAALLVTSFRNNRKLLIFGNGGSASDAQHLCGELVVRFQKNRRALPAVALCGDAAVMTACANDFAYEEVFARQIEALGNPGDVALGISTSGKSPNVIKGLIAARARGLSTILMTGPNGGSAAALCDLLLAAPGANTARIQELHLAAYHAVCEIVESEFCGESAR